MRQLWPCCAIFWWCENPNACRLGLLAIFPTGYWRFLAAMHSSLDVCLSITIRNILGLTLTLLLSARLLKALMRSGLHRP